MMSTHIQGILYNTLIKDIAYASSVPYIVSNVFENIHYYTTGFY